MFFLNSNNFEMIDRNRLILTRTKTGRNIRSHKSKIYIIKIFFVP